MKYFVMFRKSISSFKNDYGDFFDGPVAKTLPSHHRGPGPASGSAGEYQADERAGVARLSWRVSGR